jgi:ATP-dependent DNA helicase RecG
MDISEVTDLHLKTFNTSWDYYIDNHHSVEDISLDKVRDFIELANKYKDIKITDDPVRLLNKFELIRENKISYDRIKGKTPKYNEKVAGKTFLYIL